MRAEYKTVKRVRAEYAPFDRHSEFDVGMVDYILGIDLSDQYDGIQGQAYDLGMECAARLKGLAVLPLIPN